MNKTEHSGPKKGRGGYYGRKRLAKQESNKRRREAGKVAAVLAFGLLLPGIAMSEGAVRLLGCDVVQVCDAAGSCKPDSAQVTFRMQPLTVGADGAGTYALSYGDKSATMEAHSPAGPFLWTVGTERNVLLASSETAFLWHQLALDDAPVATIRFLSCSFGQ